MSKSSNVYKITILNWDKYNLKAKKGHPCIMLSKDFLDDVKIKRLPSGGKLLYLWLLLRRGDVDTTFVEASHEDLVRYAGGSGQVVSRLLDQLESFQLVTSENITLLYNRIEKNIKEYKLKEYNKPDIQKPEILDKSISTQAAKAVAVVDVKLTPIKFSETKQVQIKSELVQAWADTYDKDFLTLSLKEMRNWVLSNPHKAPKSAWAKFMNGWFARGWEKYRTTLKSNPIKLTIDDLDDLLGDINGK